MEEIFQLIKAFNRLEERVAALTAKVDILVKSPFRKIALDEPAACKLLGVSPRTLARLRTEGKIPYVKIHRRTVYRTADLYRYLKENSQKNENPFERE
jgi:hypothetical protein